MRLAIEEKRLAYDRPKTVNAERLGYEKCGFRRRPRQETLRIGGNEDHRHGESFEDLIDRFKTRASVGELNVCEDEAWPFAHNGRDRLAMGARNIDDAVPLLLDEGLKVEGNERLVLDDQDIGANLVGDLLARGVNERSGFLDRAIERARDFGGIEAFERTKKKRDTRTQRNRFEIAMRPRFVAGERSLIDMIVDRHGRPDLEEQAVKRCPRIGAFRKLGRIGAEGLQRGENVRVSPGLRPCQSPRKPAQIGDMRGDFLRYWHGRHLFYLRVIFRDRSCQVDKFQNTWG